jgi:hypothetical protein
MSTTKHVRHAQQRLRRIAAEWPADPLRPKIQLKTFLAALAEHPALSPTAVAAMNALHQNEVSGHVSGLSSGSTAVNHNFENFQVPIPQTVLNPASMPLHYVRLKEGYEKTLKGIGRPRWKIFFGVW